MILVDTSAWIEFFRGREPLASAVDAVIADNEAAFCGPVETELRRGLIDERERRKVIPLLSGCHFLDSPERLWMEAGDLGFMLRRRGVTPKSFDLLIAVHALSHSAAILTADKDFSAMQNAGVPLVLSHRLSR